MDFYSYDANIDAIFFKSENYEYAYSIELTGGIILDLNKTEDVIGLEILDASKNLNIDKNYFKNTSKVNANIQVKEGNIIISLTFISDQAMKTFESFVKGFYSDKLESSFITA